jgi:hypothetical protein
MSVTTRATVAAALLLGSASATLAASHHDTQVRPVIGHTADERVAMSLFLGRDVVVHPLFIRMPHSGNGGAVETASLPWPAPVGHHQPRAKDVSANMHLSPVDEERRKLDEALVDRALDGKLTICRRC